MYSRLTLRCALIGLLLCATSPGARAEETVVAGLSTPELISSAREYREALERVVVFHVRDVERATEVLEKRRELLTRGIAARREVEDAERALADARAKLEKTRDQIAQADHALAEALAPPAPPSESSTRAPVTQSPGHGAWSLADTSRLDQFFRQRFGRPLPISAYGQTPVHDRLRLDHHQAIDVAVHPDSPEGLALATYLRSAGIPFLAFRSAVAGEATGAHIHVGVPSPRTTTLGSR